MLRRHKRLVGALTIWPFIWFALYVVGAVAFVFVGPTDGGLGLIAVAMLVSLATALSSLVLFVWLLVDMCTDARLAETERVTWILLLVLGSLLVMPVYWYVRIWREQPPAPRAAPAC